jgi:hypothetical protein
MNQNLVGSTYGRFCIKFSQNRMKGVRHRLSEPTILSRSKNLTFAKTVNISAKPPLLIHILPPFNI